MYKFITDFFDRVQYEGYLYRELGPLAGGDGGEGNEFDSEDTGEDTNDDEQTNDTPEDTTTEDEDGLTKVDYDYDQIAVEWDPTMNSNDMRTTNYEGGSVTQFKDGSYTDTRADNTTSGYDASTGVSYETTVGSKYGVTATSKDGTVVNYNNKMDMEADLEQKRWNKAVLSGAAKGLIFGPAGTIVGMTIAGVSYKAANPTAMQELANRDKFNSNVTGTTENLELDNNQVKDFLNGTGSVHTDSTGSLKFTGQSLADKYVGKEVTEANVQMEYLDYAKERQDKWDEIFGSTQDHLAAYYKDLTPDSLEAQEITAIQSSYQQQTKQYEQMMAQRGMTGSGLTAAGLTQLTQASAQDKAYVRANSEQKVMGQKQSFLTTGINQQTGIQSNIASAYNAESSMDIIQQNIAANKNAADKANKYKMYGNLARLGTSLLD